jgi:RNA polymerase sigma factor (sigma-70 family)
MPQPELRTLLRHIQRLTGTSADGVLTDRDLLQRFVRHRAEDAFAALVQRHGSLVLSVCRRLLRSEQDAEDVFQATFLILARKASTVQWRDTVGPWLHSVALRLSQKMRTAKERREQHERRAAEVRPLSFEDDPSWREVCVALEEEVARLPERYRTPLLLCCWEGKSRDEAAQHLGWSLGTVKGRLERGRELLRRRLEQRGLVLSAGLLALSVAACSVPESLAGATVRAARVTAGALPEAVERLLAMGTAMLGTAKWKIALAFTIGLLTVGIGLGLSSYLARPAPSPEIAAKPETPPDAEKPEPELLPPPKDQTPVPIVRADAESDPLPQGAVRRLGTIRWRMTDALKAVACSGDGKRLASVDNGGMVQVWDAGTGKELRHLTLGAACKVAISKDGELVATSVETDKDGEEKIYLWKEGETQGFTVSDRVYSLLLDSNRLWVGGRDGFYCWDIEKGDMVLEHKFATPGRVRAMASSPGAPGLLAVGTTAGLFLLDDSGRELDAVPFKGVESANTVALAPDGKSVAVGIGAGNLYVWDIIDNHLKPRVVEKAQDTGIEALVYSPDSTRLISVDEHGRCVVSNARTGDAIASSTLDRHGSVIGSSTFSTGCLILSPDGLHCYGQLGTKEKHLSHHLSAWEVSTGKETLPRSGHEAAIGQLSFQRDGSLLSLAEDGVVIHWDLKGDEVRRQRFSSPLVDRALLTDDGRMTAILETPRIGIFDISTRKLLWELPGKELTRTRAALSPDRNTLVVAQAVSLSFHFLKEKALEEVNTGGPSVDGLVFSSDGRKVALVNHLGTRIWSVPQRRLLYTLEKIECYGLLTFSPNGSQLAVWSGANLITLVNEETRIPQSEIRLDARVVHALAFGPSPDLLTVGTDNGIHILDTRTGKEVLRWNGHNGAVRSLAYSLEQGLLATGGVDTTVLLWDLNSIFERRVGAEDGPMQKDQALLWNDLGSTDPLRGITALRALSAEKVTTLALLRERLLTPEKPFGPEPQRKLVAQLADADYKVRSSAFAELKKNARTAEPILRETYRTTADEIFRLRLRTFLTEMESEEMIFPQDERLRERRIVFLLRTMDSPGAQQLLTILTRDAKSESLRSAASAALEGMKLNDKPKE